jgi:hypothetical protein
MAKPLNQETLAMGLQVNPTTALRVFMFFLWVVLSEWLILPLVASHLSFRWLLSLLVLVQWRASNFSFAHVTKAHMDYQRSVVSQRLRFSILAPKGSVAQHARLIHPSVGFAASPIQGIRLGPNGSSNLPYLTCGKRRTEYLRPALS